MHRNAISTVHGSSALRNPHGGWQMVLQNTKQTSSKVAAVRPFQQLVGAYDATDDAFAAEDSWWGS